MSNEGMSFAFEKIILFQTMLKYLGLNIKHGIDMKEDKYQLLALGGIPDNGESRDSQDGQH